MPVKATEEVKTMKQYSAAELRSIAKRTQQLRNRGRLLPDSAMTTYFGKPAFHAYGNSNIKPVCGGLVYGDFLKTHNITPHAGDNRPQTVQTHTQAMKGVQKSQIVKVKDEKTKKVSKCVRVVGRKEQKPEPPR